MNMFEKIQAMLAESLNISIEKITPDSKIVEDLGADSLDAVELISRLEDEYNVTVEDEDVENMVTVGDLVNMVEKLIK
ncbi:MAG: acyl carrier protein [Clostridiales bacterium]|nr:acyl carrier protein [Clostridiales bacterium]